MGDLNDSHPKRLVLSLISNSSSLLKEIKPNSLETLQAFDTVQFHFFLLLLIILLSNYTIRQCDGFKVSELRKIAAFAYLSLTYLIPLFYPVSASGLYLTLCSWKCLILCAPRVL